MRWNQRPEGSEVKHSPIKQTDTKPLGNFHYNTLPEYSHYKTPCLKHLRDIREGEKNKETLWALISSCYCKSPNRHQRRAVGESLSLFGIKSQPRPQTTISSIDSGFIGELYPPSAVHLRSVSYIFFYILLVFLNFELSKDILIIITLHRILLKISEYNHSFAIS